MNLPNTRRVKSIRNFTVLCLLAFTVCFKQSLWAEPQTTTLDDIRFLTCGDGCVQVAIDGKGQLDPGTPVFFPNPSRLIYDFQNVILNYNDGRARKFPIDVGDLNAIGVSQYQRHPDVVRIVFYFRSGDEESLKSAITLSEKNGAGILTYSVDGKGIPPLVDSSESIGLFDKLMHRRVGPERDRFSIHSTRAFNEPSVRNVPGGITLHFKGINFQVPAGSGDELQIPVSGALVDEIQIVNRPDDSTLFIRLKDSARSFDIDSQIKREDDFNLNFDVMRSYSPTQTVPEPKVLPEPVTSSEGKVTGLVHVLGTTMEQPASNDKSGSSKIVRIQYQPLSIGERFIIEATGDFNPKFQKLGFPNRLNMRADNTIVLLPKEADDKFQVKIEGAMSKLMKVFLKETDGIPESVIQFYYEITDKEDVQYNFYVTDTDDVYYLDLIPIALAFPAEPPAKPAIPKIKHDPAPPPEPVKVIESKPVKPSEKVEITVVTDDVDEIETEALESDSQPVKSDTLTFKIPESADFEPVVSIPQAEDSADEIIEDEPEPVAPVEIEQITPAEPESIEEETINDEPETAIAEPEIIEAIKLPEPVEVDQSAFAPVKIEYIKSDNHDRFVITSNDPIDDYVKSELNYPSRLAIEFPGRSIDFNSLKPGTSKYLSGITAESVRIIERDFPSKRSTFYIFLNGKWEDIDCEMSSSPNKMIVNVRSLSPAIPTAVAENPVPPPEPIAPTVKTVTVKPTETGTQIEPDPVQEIPKVQKPETKTVVEPVVEEPVEEPVAVTVEPEPVVITKSVKSEPVQPVPVESKPEIVQEEPVIIETTSDDTPLESVVIEEPKETEEDNAFKLSFLLDDEDAVDSESDIVIVDEVVEIEEPMESDEIEESIVETNSDEFVEPDVEIVDETDNASEDLVAMTFHKTDAFPLKKNETVKVGSSIDSIEVNSTGLGGFIISSSSGNLPEPDVKWWKYPMRIGFNFDGIGVDIGGANPAKWSSRVDSDAISKIQLDQHSGGRIPLAATLNLYLKSGYDDSNLAIKLEQVGNSALKVSLVKPEQLVTISSTDDSKPKPQAVEPVIEEPSIEVTDDDFTLEDLETSSDDIVTEETEVREGTGRYVSGEVLAKVSGGEVVEEESPEEKLVTLVVQNAEIEQVLFLIAENANIDISIESKAVRGTISLRVTAKPIGEVLDLISTQGNFKWNNYKGTYIIGSEDFIWDVPGVIKAKIVRLKYADPLKIRQVLTQLRLGSPRSVSLYQGGQSTGIGRGQVPTADNALILKGDATQIQDMLDIIAELDIPPLLIKVNMKVVEYSLSDDRNTGFNWSILPTGGTTDESQKGFISFKLSENAAPDGPLTMQGFKRTHPFDINMIFNFLEDKGNAKILADSTLTVTNGGRGEFFVGETVPYRSTFQVSDFGRVTQRVQQESIGITMRFTAQASASDGMVTLYLDPQVSNLKEITDIGPRTSNKNFKTTIRISSGQPYAIGGLINETDRTSYDKVPFLGDLPLVGTLFKGKSRQISRSEMVVIFTPEIVHDAATQRYPEIYNFDEVDGVSFGLY